MRDVELHAAFRNDLCLGRGGRAGAHFSYVEGAVSERGIALGIPKSHSTFPSTHFAT